MSCEDFHRQQLCIYRQDKTLNKDVIKLHKKNERKEFTITYRKKHRTYEFKYRGFCYSKKTKITTGGIYNISG